MQLSQLAGLALSTFVSEDLASIGAGVLSAEGRLPLVPALVACTVGVYLGDLGLWGAGRLLGPRLAWLSWLTRRFDLGELSTIGARIDTHLGTAVVLSRFVPGSRLPVYLAAGVWGRRPIAFAAWSLLGVILWTPLLVVSAALLGDAVIGPLIQGIRSGVLTSLLTGLAAWGLLTLGGRVVTATVRRYHQRCDQTTETPI